MAFLSIVGPLAVLFAGWPIALGQGPRALAVDTVVDELKRYDFEIVSTNLPEERERQLREAYAQG